jgi:hypothetical protein
MFQKQDQNLAAPVGFEPTTYGLEAAALSMLSYGADN